MGRIWRPKPRSLLLFSLRGETHYRSWMEVAVTRLALLAIPKAGVNTRYARDQPIALVAFRPSATIPGHFPAKPALNLGIYVVLDIDDFWVV